MRVIIIFIAILSVVIVGFAYVRNPYAFDKLLADATSIVNSLSPVQVGSTGPSIADLIDGKLVSTDGSPFHFPSKPPATSIQYYAIYYSAQWFPPCHVFTPVLVDWYKKFKPVHSNFELIFVSDDHDKASMLAFMKEMSMPWPALSFYALNHDGKGIEKFAGNGIPDLVLVDATGKVLSDSFTWTGSYLGPQHVLDDIQQIVPIAAPPPPPLPPPPVAVPPPPIVLSPPPPPVKIWSPPAQMPAQPNWTWNASDGKTYQDVIVTGIEPETVSISHSMGVAHISMSLLPPEIQKQLNYDPVAAAAARSEAKRENSHPYYTMATLAEAQGLAAKMNWPLAWVVSGRDLLAATNPDAASSAGLTQMSVDHLKSQSIVLFIDGYTELDALPAAIRDQLFHLDDGPLPGGHHFIPPKIVFSSSDITKLYGRISYTQLKAGGAEAIDAALAPPSTDSTGQTATNVPSAGVPGSSPPTAASVMPANAAGAPASVPAPSPSPAVAAPWAPPDVMPAQPNWTWTALDGRTYQDVVVIKIEPDTVTINHSLGVAHIPMNLLPQDIQKQLKHGPPAAASNSTPH